MTGQWGGRKKTKSWVINRRRRASVEESSRHQSGWRRRVAPLEVGFQVSNGSRSSPSRIGLFLFAFHKIICLTDLRRIYSG